KALSLASLLFIYPVLALSFFGVRYSETIHRITMTRVFDETIFGSTMADSLAAIGLALLFLSLCISSVRLRFASIVVFGSAIAGFVAFSEYLLIGGMLTFPFLIGFIIWALARRKKGDARGTHVSSPVLIDGKRVGTAFLAMVIVMEIGALLRWISYAAFPTEIYSNQSWILAELESALFHSFGLLSPLMLVLLAFSFLFKDHIANLMRRGPRDGTGKIERLDSTTVIDRKNTNDIYYSATSHPRFRDNVQKSRNQRISPIVLQESGKLSHSSSKPAFAILLSAVVASTIIMLYPHLPSVNESGTGISTDERAYIKWLDELRIIEGSPNELVSAVFSINAGDRPLIFLLILFLSNLSGLPDATIVRFLPVVLAPGLVLSSYMFVRHGYFAIKRETISIDRNRTIAAVIAFGAGISPQIVVGLYSGFLANWLALIPALFAMLFSIRIFDEAVRTNNERSWRRIAKYSVCLLVALTLTMLSHVYTWGFVILVTFLFACISYFSLRRTLSVSSGELLKVTAVLASIISASIITDFAKSSYFGVSTGLSSDSLLAGRSFDLTNFYSRWETLDFTLRTYVGGFLSNPVIILLALIWVLKVDYLRGFDRLILSIIFILAIPILFGTTVIQARLLYVVPLFIPAFLALLKTRQNRDRVYLYSIVAVMLCVAVYALRATANLYLVVPENVEFDQPFLIS
ncbi:MAG: hypothetical protein ACREBU_05385, partial [Nitrososphaera sp.]